MQLKHKKVVSINGKGLTVGIAVTRFNEQVTKKLLEAAVKALEDSGVKKTAIKIIEIPGAVELPYTLQKLAKTKKYDCLVALGCVIRGDTPHFDYVCNMAQEGVLRVTLNYHIPIGFGVLTVNTQKQAEARYHVGAEAALAAIELATI